MARDHGGEARHWLPRERSSQHLLYRWPRSDTLIYSCDLWAAEPVSVHTTDHCPLLVRPLPADSTAEHGSSNAADRQCASQARPHNVIVCYTSRVADCLHPTKTARIVWSRAIIHNDLMDRPCQHPSEFLFCLSKDLA